MLSIRELKILLRTRRPKHIIEKTNLSYSTIRAIRDGLHKNPTQETLRKLSKYFADHQ